MKALILAGGKGTRFMEETNIRPKPMIEINGKPIILHIINHYKNFGINDFIILAGYKVESFSEYFSESGYQKDGELYIDSDGAKIQIFDTGIETQTGARIKKAKNLIHESTFLLTYGDGISNVNITNLIDFHKSNKKIATVTAVRPPARFGSLTIVDKTVVNFGEKIQSNEGWINGGFFILNKEVFDYIEDGETVIFEKKPLEKLTKTGNLAAFCHEGFWYPLDTLREKQILEEFIANNNGKLPW
tara:strand:+ start:1201 stop:1935 length:735 start_codon:yes stop_codon:yes gene_type:complete